MQRAWTRYLRERWGSCEWQRDASGQTLDAVFELKVVVGEVLRGRDFRPQQIPALLKAAGKLGWFLEMVRDAWRGKENANNGERAGLAYKIPDAGMGLKPFDCFYLGAVRAFVVIGFRGWQNGEVVVVPVEMVACCVALGEVIEVKRCMGSGWVVKLM